MEKRKSRSPWKGAVFPYLSILLYVDAGAAIDVLSIAMDSPDATFPETGDGTIPPPVSNASAVPSSLRKSSSTVPRGRGAGDEMEGRGGVWGKRIGKGRARAIGWAGAPVVAASGMAAGAGDGGVGAGMEAWTESGGAGGSAEVVENVCPSRKTIIEVRGFCRQKTPSVPCVYVQVWRMCIVCVCAYAHGMCACILCVWVCTCMCSRVLCTYEGVCLCVCVPLCAHYVRCALVCVCALCYTPYEFVDVPVCTCVCVRAWTHVALCGESAEQVHPLRRCRYGLSQS